MKNLFSLSFLVFIILLAVSPATQAMGGKAPAKEEPKYKLEILKMEIINGPSTTEVTVPKKQTPKK
jgi:hypothetical protein